MKKQQKFTKEVIDLGPWDCTGSELGGELCIPHSHIVAFKLFSAQLNDRKPHFMLTTSDSRYATLLSIFMEGWKLKIASLQIRIQGRAAKNGTQTRDVPATPSANRYPLGNVSFVIFPQADE